MFYSRLRLYLLGWMYTEAVVVISLEVTCMFKPYADKLLSQQVRRRCLLPYSHHHCRLYNLLYSLLFNRAGNHLQSRAVSLQCSRVGYHQCNRVGYHRASQAVHRHVSLLLLLAVSHRCSPADSLRRSLQISPAMFPRHSPAVSRPCSLHVCLR